MELSLLVYFRIGVGYRLKRAKIGDIPLAFVMTLTAGAPFTTQDQALGIAYISIIIVWCFLTMFPFGGWMLVKRDFEMPLVREDVEAYGRGTGVAILQKVKRIVMRRGVSPRIACTNGNVAEKISVSNGRETKRTADVKISEMVTSSSSHTTRGSTATMEDLNVIQPIRSHHSHDETELQDLSLAATPSLTHHRNLTHPTPFEPLYKRIAKKVLKFLLSLISPPSIAIMLSLLIALVPQLKALFVADVPGVNMPNAPDGLPPLEWILDIANFGGGASVPTGLVVLGASLASLSLRHGLPPW
jgi:auxin efflux carrier family protein